MIYTYTFLLVSKLILFCYCHIFQAMINILSNNCSYMQIFELNIIQIPKLTIYGNKTHQTHQNTCSKLQHDSNSHISNHRTFNQLVILFLIRLY